jgi:hypothetical protein
MERPADRVLKAGRKGPRVDLVPRTPRASGSDAAVLALVLSDVLLAPTLAAFIEVAREARSKRERPDAEGGNRAGRLRYEPRDPQRSRILP